MGAGAGGNFGKTRGSSKREELLKRATNQKLKNTINEMYRPNAKKGDSGLSDVIRYKRKTNELVGGKSHIRKGKHIFQVIKIFHIQSFHDAAQILLAFFFRCPLFGT